MHTQMSQMDGMTFCKRFNKKSNEMGLKSIAITDHGVVQSISRSS